MKVAKEKVWADAEGNLVPDGDESASVLVAAKGEIVTDSHVAQFKGGDEFFTNASEYQERSAPEKEPMLAPFLPENLLDTVSKLSGPGLAKLRSKLGGQFGIQLKSTGDAANVELTQIIFQTLDASPENPYLVTFDQIILTPFTAGPITDGVTTNASPTVTSATAAFTATDLHKAISGTGIPANSFIGVINSATSIGLSSSAITNVPVNATATGSGLTLTITGRAGQFDLVERDARRRVFDGASAGGTAVLTSATMNWQPSDVDKLIQVGRNPGRYYGIVSRQSSTQVTLSGDIVLPSAELTLTMDGSDESEVVIATKSGFTDGATTGSWSRLFKPITVDKTYSVVFVPGTAGDGIYSITAQALYPGFIDPDPTPLLT